MKTPKNTVAHSGKTPKNAGADLLEICNGVCLPDPTKLGLLGINFYKRIGRWTAHIWYENDKQLITSRLVFADELSAADIYSLGSESYLLSIYAS